MKQAESLNDNSSLDLLAIAKAQHLQKQTQPEVNKTSHPSTVHPSTIQQTASEDGFQPQVATLTSDQGGDNVAIQDHNKPSEGEDFHLDAIQPPELDRKLHS
mgnify:CR=1 FL=1